MFCFWIISVGFFFLRRASCFTSFSYDVKCLFLNIFLYIVSPTKGTASWCFITKRRNHLKHPSSRVHCTNHVMRVTKSVYGSDISSTALGDTSFVFTNNWI